MCFFLHWGQRGTKSQPNRVSNYRPMSKLLFVKHSREISYSFSSRHIYLPTLVKCYSQVLVFNDVFTVDSGTSAVLVLSDLSAAFDTVEYNILLSRLEQLLSKVQFYLGLNLVWLTGVSVHLGDCSSSAALVTCGVPQGSILTPLLFNLYLFFDIQIYRPRKCSASPLEPLFNCLK